VRTLWSRSCRSSLRTGKPSTRAERPTGKGPQVASGAGREVREMRRAGTLLPRTRWQLESRMMRKCAPCGASSTLPPEVVEVQGL
jgi:hypothetical protein